MNFPQAVESALKQWITFSGRGARSEYWWFLVAYLVLIAFVHIINDTIDHNGTMRQSGNVPLLLGASALVLFNCALLIWFTCGLISVFVRRMHDTNHSGWWYWLYFTLIGAFFPLLFWKCTKGTEGPNRFGADPLQGNQGNLIQ